MEILDRTTQPEFTNIDKIPLIEPEIHTLKNGIKVFCINAGEQDVVKVDIVFNAGEAKQTHKLVASTTNMMMSEGTQNYTGYELSEKIDFLGSYVYCNTGKHTSNITFFSLNKYLQETLSYVEDIIKKPIFPENELQTYIGKKKQQFEIENKKVEVIAHKMFYENLFGANHPYGKNIEASDFDMLNVEMLKEFHKENYTYKNCYIVVAGIINSDTLDLFDKYLGQDDFGADYFINSTNADDEIVGANQHKIYVPKDDAVQSALRIGKLMVNKLHPDFPKLQVLNTVLGGYFGSRLMSNIREDKGYTYGIGSGMVTLKEAGYFVIVSQVGKDVREDAISEIYKELYRLRTENVPDEELQLVKNYMLGTVLRNFDGPFAQADSFKTIYEYELGYEYYKNFIEIIKTITPKELNELANKYFNEESMYEIVVG